MKEEFKFRKYEDKDFDDIYEIYMQEHIIPYMSFDNMPKEDFRKLFKQLQGSSTFYVIEHNGKAVATRRIAISGHTAEIMSFGVHKDYLRHKFGTTMTNEILTMIKKEHPKVIRIEGSQETDNEPAGKLTDKIGFKVESIFTDWLPRYSGTHKNRWFISERWIALDLGRVSDKDRVKLDPKLYNHTKMPELKSDLKSVSKNVEISHSGGVRRFTDICFFEVKTNGNATTTEVKNDIRKYISEQLMSFKKVEIFTHDPIVIKAVEELGFVHRGNKKDAILQDGKYIEQAGFELNLYDLSIVPKFLQAEDVRDIGSSSKTELIKLSGELKAKIEQMKQLGEVDTYGAKYLENIAFRLIRDNLLMRINQKGEMVELDISEKTPVTTEQLKEVPNSLKPTYEKIAKLVQKDLVTSKVLNPELGGAQQQEI